MNETRVAIVGASSAKVMQVTITFASPFPTIPIVVATALQSAGFAPESIGDTFAVSITGVTKTKFTANIVRVDAGPGWAQKLRLGYHASTASLPTVIKR